MRNVIPELIARKCNDILKDDLREIKDNLIAFVDSYLLQTM